MPKQLSGLLDRNVLTILAVAAIVVVLLVAAVAAITGNYDSASVRAFIDDIKYLAAALGAGVAVARGLIAAAQRIGDGATEAALVSAAPAPTDSTTPPAEAEVPGEPPVQPSQTGLAP
jgi:hypothetical protein